MSKNTIILNDQSSANIAGLLIQELPPITKPAQRTEVETIDGRDGDIVTPLGFAAYDKEFTIGLYGNFDINAVIAFFNSEGTVVFSNEPDKYYNYQITEQIDFERLVRFRTAKVKMHCQPFKYSTTEGAETLDPPAENLLSIPDFTKTTNGVTLTVSGGTISVSGTPSAATEFYVPTGGLNLPAGSYALTAEATGTRVAAASIRLIGSVPSNADSFGGNYLGLKNAQPVTISDTLSAAKTFNYLWFYITAGGDVDFNMTAEVQNNAEKIVSDEGTFLTLENSAEAPFNKLDLKGDSFQQTYTGKNTLKFSNESNSDRSRFTYTTETGEEIVATKTASGGRFVARYEAYLEAGKTYVMSFGRRENANEQMYIYSDRLWGTSVKILKPTDPTIAITTSATYVIGIFSNAAVDSVVIVENPMLEEGTTPSDFEPYVGGIPAPNPDFPQDIKVVTGEQTVFLTGKNLFLGSDRTSSGITTTYDSETGALHSAGTATGDYPWITGTRGCHIPAGTEITASVKPALTKNTYYIRLYYDLSDLTLYDTVTLGAANPSRTITTAHDILAAAIFSYTPTGTVLDETHYVQIELGSTRSEFDPHKEQSYPLSLGTLELAKIGDYQDYLWTDGEKWYKHKAIKKTVFDGSENWTKTSDVYRLTATFGDLVSASAEAVAFCNSFIYWPNTGTISTSMPNGKFGWAADKSNINFRADSIANVADFKSYLSSNHATVYYALGEPTDEEITDATLISQLDALHGATAYRGRTHITSISGSADNLPHIVAAEVMKFSDGTITNAGNIYSRPTLTIYGSGDITINLNGIQLFQIALGDTGYITIDTAAMEAYKDSPGNLQNRLVTGDYENFALQPGENQITFSGLVTKCIVENYSRWL